MKFEFSKIHSGLLAVRTGLQVIGYVNLNPDTGEWFWFYNSGVSIGYSNYETAVEELIRTYSVSKFDVMAKKAGTFNNPDYTKR